MLLRLLHRVLLPCSAAHAARANIGSSCSTRQHDSSCANMTAHAARANIPCSAAHAAHANIATFPNVLLFFPYTFPELCLVFFIHIPRAVHLCFSYTLPELCSSCSFHTHSQSYTIHFNNLPTQGNTRQRARHGLTCILLYL